jgi:hypothetical protein
LSTNPATQLPESEKSLGAAPLTLMAPSVRLALPVSLTSTCWLGDGWLMASTPKATVDDDRLACAVLPLPAA